MANITIKEALLKTVQATKTYVDNQIASLVDTAPKLLDTLNEISNALGNDPDHTTTMLNELSKKADTQYVDEQTILVQQSVDARLDGLKILQLTQSEYDALSSKDNNTLYLIIQ